MEKVKSQEAVFRPGTFFSRLFNFFMMEVDMPNGVAEHTKERFTSGLILPPPEIKCKPFLDSTLRYPNLILCSCD